MGAVEGRAHVPDILWGHAAGNRRLSDLRDLFLFLHLEQQAPLPTQLLQIRDADRLALKSGSKFLPSSRR